MAGRAGEDKDVPDEMTVADASVVEKNQAGRVGDPAGEEPDHGLGGNDENELPKRDEDRPAHSEIQNHRDFFPADAGAQFNSDAGEREEPDHGKNCPAERAAHRPEGKWRIGARDQEKNRGVIDDLENALEAGLRAGGIKGGAEIEQTHRRDENDSFNIKSPARLSRGCETKKKTGHQ